MHGFAIFENHHKIFCPFLHYNDVSSNYSSDPLLVIRVVSLFSRNLQKTAAPSLKLTNFVFYILPPPSLPPPLALFSFSLSSPVPLSLLPLLAVIDSAFLPSVTAQTPCPPSPCCFARSLV